MDPATIALLGSLLTAGIGAAGQSGGLFGSKEKKSSTYDKPQLGLINDIVGQVKGGLGNQDITQNQGYQQGQSWLNSLFSDPEFFQRFEAPLQRQFQEQTVPDLANRFASMGSGGSLGSTAFRNQLGREGSNLGTNIAALRGNMQQQGVGQQLGYSQQPIQNLMQLLQGALTPTQNVYQGPSQGLLGGALPGLIGGLSAGYGQQLGQSMAPRFSGQYPGTF